MLKFARDIFFNSKDYFFLSRLELFLRSSFLFFFFFFKGSWGETSVNEIEDLSKRRGEIFFYFFKFAD